MTFQTIFPYNSYMLGLLRLMKQCILLIRPTTVSHWAVWEDGRILAAAILLGSGLIACAPSKGEQTAILTEPLPTATHSSMSVYEPDMATFETVWNSVADGF